MPKAGALFIIDSAKPRGCFVSEVVPAPATVEMLSSLSQLTKGSTSICQSLSRGDAWYLRGDI